MKYPGSAGENPLESVATALEDTMPVSLRVTAAILFLMASALAAIAEQRTVLVELFTNTD